MTSLASRLATAALAAGGVAAIAINVAAFTQGQSADAAMRAARPAPVPAVAVPTPTASPAPVAVRAPAVAPTPEPLVVRRVLEVPRPFVHGKWTWDESGAPATGPLVITVDRAAQTISVFRDGYEIGAAVVLYGANDMPTPLGTFPITQKDADHVSNLYDAPMPYMLRMTNDGISIHGSDVRWGYATHGCIGVPVAFARKLFAAAKLGDRVIVTDGRRLDLGKPITA